MFAFVLGAQPQWVHYTTSNSGLPSNSVLAILVDSNNVKWITTYNGFVRLKGNTWTVYDTTNSGIPTNLCASVMQDRQNNIWMIIPDKGVVKFDGINWTFYNDENTGYSLHNITSISIDSLNNKWVGIGGGILMFNDTVWTRYHIGNSGIPSNGVLSVYNQGSIVWVGTYDEGVGRFDGQNWTTYNASNSGLPSNYINRMNKDLNDNIWFATLAGGAAKFNYLQNQWTVYNTGNSSIPSNYVSVVYIDNNNVKWIGTYEGFAIFNDTTWQVFPYSFIGSVRNFAKDRYGNMWICGGGGIYVYNPAGVVGIENNTNIVPENYLLIRNYPNPFNSQTKIEVTIPENTLMSLNIYDINGRLIEQIAKGNYRKGIYMFSFKGDNLASGVYFVQLKTDSKIKVHKIILQK